jgi:hypothetical protein
MTPRHARGVVSRVSIMRGSGGVFQGDSTAQEEPARGRRSHLEIGVLDHALPWEGPGDKNSLWTNVVEAEFFDAGREVEG